MPRYLYHYTDENGIIGIETHGVIQMSRDTNRDAVLGEGVYFTDLAPGNDDHRLLTNNYGQNWHGQQDKIAYFIRISYDDLPGIRRMRIGDRLIYVYPAPIRLSEINHRIRKRY